MQNKGHVRVRRSMHPCQAPLVHQVAPPVKQIEECPRDLRQCDVTKASAQSHFSLCRLKRSQHRPEGEGTKVLHHHFLQPKPTIHRVCHILGKVRLGELEPMYRIMTTTAWHQCITRSVHNEDSKMTISTLTPPP